MAHYVNLTCNNPPCNFNVSLGDGTEFFVDSTGRQLPYGSPMPLSKEAETAGVSGFWKEWVCWSCGRLEMESLQLPKPCHEPFVARQKMPLRDPRTIPRFCPGCGGILCDCELIKVFTEYWEDPRELRGRLETEMEELEKRDPLEPADEGDLLSYFAGTCRETVKERLAWVAERLKETESLKTPEEVILYRLGLPPKLPVDHESVEKLRSLKRKVFSLKDFSGLQSGKNSEGNSEIKQALWDALKRVDSSWNVALDTASGRNSALQLFSLHVHLAERISQAPEATFKLFKRRCPRCRKECLELRWHRD